MPLHLQFVLVLIVGYAVAMTSLTAVIAVDRVSQAGFTLTMAVLGWAFALVIIPTWLGPRYTDG